MTLRSFASDRIEATDWQGNALNLKTSEVVRITFGTQPQAWTQEGTVKARLRDGQVVVGQFTASDSVESIRLTLAGGMVADLALDDLMSIAFDREARVSAVEDDDAVLLATGETLVGYVDSISADHLAFVVGDADKPIQIPLERIKALAIANKPEQAEASAGLVRVELADDSSLLLKDAALDRQGQVLTGVSTLSAASGKLTVAMDKVMRIEPMLGRYALLALSTMPMKQLSGGEVFGVEMPPTLAPDGSIQLHAPTTLGFSLPRGAKRLTLVAGLDLDPDLPAAQRAMAGCELVIYDGGKAIGGCTLLPDQAPQRINLPLNGRDLRIEIKPGVNGPVLDRVRLTEAEVLVGGE